MGDKKKMLPYEESSQAGIVQLIASLDHLNGAAKLTMEYKIPDGGFFPQVGPVKMTPWWHYGNERVSPAEFIVTDEVIENFELALRYFQHAKKFIETYHTIPPSFQIFLLETGRQTAETAAAK